MSKSIGIRDFYKIYKEDCKSKNLNVVDYKTYSLILKDFNLKLRDYILSNENIRLPYNLGRLMIIKFENKYDIDKQHKWKIDFKKTKEMGYKVYYGAEYGYRWKWIKEGLALKGKRYYTFKPCRKASRLITVKLNEGIDYYTKY